MNRDVFAIRVGRENEAEVCINGVPLLELIRAAEAPLIELEKADRVAGGDEPSDMTLTAGEYTYRPLAQVLYPEQVWLGQPGCAGFDLAGDDIRNGKAIVLGCTCGITECWFVQVRITIGDNTVTWSDFGQFHRKDWRYDLGPFHFERSQYEVELGCPITTERCG